jgi:hypothetical protein
VPRNNKELKQTAATLHALFFFFKKKN